MKHILSAVVIATALILGCTKSKPVIRLEMPLEPKVTATPAEIARCIDTYHGYDGVYLSTETAIEHSGSKDGTKSALFGALGVDWTYRLVYRTEYVILNPQASWLTTYSIPFAPEKFYMQVTYPDSTAKLFDFKDMTKHKDADGRTSYKIAFPQVTKGTAVAIGYQLDFNIYTMLPPLEEDIDLQFFMPCEKLKADYAYPDWWTINLKHVAPNVEVPVVYTADSAHHKRVLTYEAEHIPAIKQEPYSPPFKQVAKYLELMVTHLKMMGQNIDRGESWQKISEDFRKYALKKSGKRSDELEKTIDSLLAGQESPLSKVNTVLSYVSDNIDFTDVDNDGNPGKTLTTKKGSVYDVVGLVQSMLTYAGFDATYILVHDAWDGYFDSSYISGSQLYAPAIKVVVDGKPIAIFPTYEHLLAPSVPFNYRGQDALELRENDQITFWRVPDESTGSTSFTDTYQINIDSSGELLISRRHVLDGDIAYAMRRELAEYSPQERRDSLKSDVKFPGVTFTVDSLELHNDTLYDKPLAIDYRMTIHNVVSQTPDELIVQTGDIFPFGDNSLLDDSTTRTNDIYIPDKVTYDRSFTFTLPAGWQLAALPQSELVETELGSLRSDWEKAEDGIHLRQIVTLNKNLQPKEKYPMLLSLIGRSSKAVVPPLILTRTQETGE